MRRIPLRIISVGTLLAATVGVASAQGSHSSPPRFTRSILLETTSDTSANVSIGDLNGDGHLDLVLVKGRHWPGMSRVLLGDGHGRFPDVYDLGATRYRSYSGRLVDMDGDGDLDIVLSNDRPDIKLILLNDGRGHFQPGSPFGQANWETRNVSVADLNADGRPDIIVANRADKATAYVCLNQGGGRFTADCNPLAAVSATTISAVDINRDDRPDLVVPHRDGGQSYAYLNQGNASFPAGAAVPFGPADATIRVAELADFDHDGLLDIVAVDERRGAAIYFGQKGGTFSPPLSLEDGKITPYALATADLNHDGSPDIVVGHVEAPTTVYFNTGSGRTYTTIEVGDNRGAAYGFAIADLDGDGLLDIAVARSEAPSMVFFADTTQQKGAMTRLRPILAVAALQLLLPQASPAQVAARDSASLSVTAQALLDAVTSGDSSVWAAHLAPEWFLSDEEGQHVTRSDFLGGLHPLPPGQQGKLTVANPHFVGGPGVVVMSYDAEEEHHYYGQLLLTTFHMTETYVRRGGRWLQIAAQATALPRPLDGRPLAPALLSEYAGTYGLTPDIRMVVTVRDSALTMGRTGRDPLPLYALDDRLFIRHGVRGFWVFERDDTGAVVELVNWRDNNKVVWHRQP